MGDKEKTRQEEKVMPRDDAGPHATFRMYGCLKIQRAVSSRAFNVVRARRCAKLSVRTLLPPETHADGAQTMEVGILTEHVAEMQRHVRSRTRFHPIPEVDVRVKDRQEEKVMAGLSSTFQYDC